ncbi:MAG TPA: hypothetical protein VEM76_02270 [Anaeromyxobacteraceae bacterium]|nr:hypothetical protein [Anaeromyxobacteraceae bacterium]
MNDRVQVGMEVRDADGKRLGKVSRCDAWGIEVVKGFWSPSEWVVRWDEVLGVKDGKVEVDRSDEDLFVLAAGGLPSRWRRGTPEPAAPPEPGPGTAPTSRRPA